MSEAEAAFEVLKACPPMEGAWPERIAMTCVCCEIVREVFIDQRPSEKYETKLDATATKNRLAAQSASHDGWLMIVIPVNEKMSRVDWWCRSCVAASLDFTPGPVTDAVRRFNSLVRVDVSAAPRRDWNVKR